MSGINMKFKEFINEINNKKKSIELTYNSKNYVVKYENIKIKDIFDPNTNKSSKKIEFKEIDNHFTPVEMLSCGVSLNGKLTVSIEGYNVEEISFENQEYVIIANSNKYIIKIIE